MSMIRQILLIILAVALLSVGGSAALSVWSTRQTLQEQWQVRNGDAATLLALALSQHHGDMSLMELVLSAQFDTGHYRRVSLTAPDGKTLFDRESPASGGATPAWFRALVPMSAEPGTGIVTNGWTTVGRVSLQAQSGWAYDSLWAALVRNSLALLALGAGAMALAAWAVARWRRGLDDVVAQAQALEQGRFTEIAVPRTRELRRVATGMNSMVQRLHGIFETQTQQLDAMRQQVQTDALTGLSNRRHFTAQLERALAGSASDGPAEAGQPAAAGADEAAPPRGALLIVRLRELEAMNAALGHAKVDRMLGAVGEIMGTYPARVEGAFAGRLNGGDLALFLPVHGIAMETAEALCATLGTALGAIDRAADLAIGGIDAITTGRVSEALARADEALARAEIEGPFGIHVAAGGGEALGETEWRQRINDALANGRVKLAEYPVVDAQGRVLHLECPLRVQLRDGGPFDAAFRWLPMASRSRVVQRVDMVAAELALQAIAADGRPRCVHVSAASLADSAFVQQLGKRLAAMPQAAGRLSLEVGEAVAAHWHRWRAAAETWRPSGARLGLENAGGAMNTLMDARQYGLDYMKVDGRFVRGLGHDARLADYARQIIATARGVGVAVYAEGVDDADDLARLWELGFDGATGPAVTRVATQQGGAATA